MISRRTGALRMGLKVPPGELERWAQRGLVPPAPARQRPPRRTPGAPGAPAIAPPAGPPALPPEAANPAHHHEDARRPRWRVTLTLPGVKLVSRSNAREHWTSRHRRDVAEAAAIEVAWHAAGLAPWHPPLPVCVTLVRTYGGRSKAMDSDNLAGAMKAIRDAAAKLIGVDDGDGRVRWRCRQRAARPGEPAGVSVRLRRGKSKAKAKK